MDALDKIIMGTAVTNLTRMDFPRSYGGHGKDQRRGYGFLAKRVKVMAQPKTAVFIYTA